MRSVIGSSIVVVAALSQLGSSDCGEAIRDDGFDLWCGEELCAWKVERGAVKRVPSWNEGDSAVELVGGDVAISQLSPFNGSDGSCLVFELIANIDDTAEVHVNVDVQGDGTLELSERLPTSNWKPLSFQFAVVTPYDGLRFEITKRGSGRGVVANVGAKRVSAFDCASMTPVDPGLRRNGAYCFTGAECASGLCMPSPTPKEHYDFITGVCVGCDYTMGDSCGGEACGLAEPFSPVFAIPVQCVAPGVKELGEECLTDAECATNICSGAAGTYGACSTCTLNGQCPSGQHCLPSGNRDGGHVPYVCGGGEHLAATGAPCASNADCASGTCNGAVRAECDGDGRSCVTSAECPFSGLQNRPCTTVGIQGGTCQ